MDGMKEEWVRESGYPPPYAFRDFCSSLRPLRNQHHKMGNYMDFLFPY